EYIKTPSVKNISPKAAYIPPANHPWRKNIANEIKLKQIRKSRGERKAEKEIKKIFGGLITFVH
ncbi:MAG: hypothetical protein AB1478_08655, partial [Nitrospirota bacterium]